MTHCTFLTTIHVFINGHHPKLGPSGKCPQEIATRPVAKNRGVFQLFLPNGTAQHCQNPRTPELQKNEVIKMLENAWLQFVTMPGDWIGGLPSHFEPSNPQKHQQHIGFSRIRNNFPQPSATSSFLFASPFVSFSSVPGYLF